MFLVTKMHPLCSLTFGLQVGLGALLGVPFTLFVMMFVMCLLLTISLDVVTLGKTLMFSVLVRLVS